MDLPEYINKMWEQSEVVGVAVQLGGHNFVIHPKYAKNGKTCYWAYGGLPLSSSLYRTTLEHEADDHFTGYEDTQVIITSLDDSGASWGRPSNEYAAYTADNVTFNNGEKGYLMSTGEAVIINDNKDIINALFAKINGADTVVDRDIWTSTLNGGEGETVNEAWYLMTMPQEHRIDGANIQSLKYVRPLARIIDNNN